MKQKIIIIAGVFFVISLFLVIRFFSEESQNQFNRSLQNAMGLKYGKMEIYIGQAKPVKQYLMVEKVSPVLDNDGDVIKSYGYGYFDINLNNKVDPNENKLGKVYFEIPAYSQYIYWNAKGIISYAK